MKTIKKWIRKNPVLLEKAKNLKYFMYLNKESKIRKQFQVRLNRKLDLDNPIYYCDKIQYLKLNWYDPLAHVCVDKYKVREYISERIGEKYLNECFGVYNDIKDLEIEKLPKSFVIKPTHTSGDYLIVRDKESVNWKDEYKKMKGWMNKKYYLYGDEWVYKNVRPRIIVEKYLQDNSGSLNDYRFFCFHGEPKFITVDQNFTNKSKIRRNVYDLNWNFLDVEIGHKNEPNQQIPMPKNLDEMIQIARVLSEPFPHVRVDLYNVDGKIIFGELTFFHQNGMSEIRPKNFELRMGDWLDLNRI